MTKTKEKPLFSAKDKWIIVGICVFLAFAVLMGISEHCESPFLPSWNTLFSYLQPTAGTPPDGEWQIHTIDVGNADSILITDSAHHILIDAGERGCEDTILAYLNALSITRLDVLVATHFHSDHIGGMDEVVRAVDVGECLLAYMPTHKTPTTRVYTDLLTALADTDTPVRDVRAGERLTVGDFTLDILAPITDATEPNNQSVVCRITCGDIRFLAMADAEITVEKELLDVYPDLSADILKVGHHGSDTSSSFDFLCAVSPRFAVIPCGNNDYGHPSKDPLAFLDRLGTSYYRSDRHGDVVFTIRGNDVSVTTER